MINSKLNSTRLERQWLEFENSIAEKLSTISFIPLVFFIIFMLGAYLSFGVWTDTQSLPNWGRFFLAQDRYWATITLLAGAFICYLCNFNNRLYRVLLMLVLSAAWLVPVMKLQQFSLECLYPLIYILICSFLLAKVQINRFILLGLIFVLFGIMNCGLYEFTLRTQKPEMLQYFSLLHLDALLIYFTHRIFAGRGLDRAFDFNPLQLYAPLPIPAESTLALSKKEKKLFFIKGCLQVLQGQFIFLLLFYFVRFPIINSSSNPSVHYFVFIFFIVAAMKMLTGLLWLFGFKVAPASYFILLAKSPLEIWQRGSTYLANFAFFNIYFPTWKRLRNAFLPSVLVIVFIFMHLYFFHEVILKSFIRLFFNNIPVTGLNPEYLLQEISWVALWLVWILLFGMFLRKFPKSQESSIGSYLLVIATHLGSAAIIPISNYLTKILFV